MKQFNLKSFFDNLTILEPEVIKRNIVILPLESKTPSKLRYISLKSAVLTNKAKVTEVNDAGNVPYVKVLNYSEDYILIPQGEHLEGAKQNRMVNISILVKPKSETIIPVSCIESGRWHHIRPDFLPGDEIITYKLRKVNSEEVSKNVKERGEFSSNQHRIWHFIENDFMKDRMSHKTNSYSEYMKEKIGRENFESFYLNLPENKNGVAIFIGDKLLSFEYFSDKNYFDEIKKRLIRAVIVDAQDYIQSNSNTKADYKFILMNKIGKLLEAEQIHKKSIGVGDDYKILIEEKDINASFLVYNDEVVHMVTYF